MRCKVAYGASTLVLLAALGLWASAPAVGSESVGLNCGSEEVSQPITLADALQSTAANNPSLAIAQSAVEGARAGVSAARAPLFPDVRLGADGERYVASNPRPVTVVGSNVLGGATTYSTYGSIDFSWILYSGGKNRWTLQSAKRQLGASEATQGAEASKALFSVLNAYADVIGAQIRLSHSRDRIAVLESMKARADDRLRRGHGTTVAVGQALAALLEEQHTFYRECHDAATKSIGLSTAIGIRLPADIQMVPTSAIPEPPTPAVENLVSAAEDDARVRAAQLAVLGAEAKGRAAHALFKPTVTLFGKRDYLGQNAISVDDASRQIGPSSYRYGVSISQPLFPLISESSTVSQARAELRKARAELEQAEVEVDAERREALSARLEKAQQVAAARVALDNVRDLRVLAESLNTAGRLDLDGVDQARLEESRREAEFQSSQLEATISRWAVWRLANGLAFPDRVVTVAELSEH